MALGAGHVRIGNALVPEIRFFAVTSANSFDTAGLTLLDPMETHQLLSGRFGLRVVEACEEALVSDVAALQKMEQKHMHLPNREGAVVCIPLWEE